MQVWRGHYCCVDVYNISSFVCQNKSLLLMIENIYTTVVSKCMVTDFIPYYPFIFYIVQKNVFHVLIYFDSFSIFGRTVLSELYLDWIDVDDFILVLYQCVILSANFRVFSTLLVKFEMFTGRSTTHCILVLR